MKIFTNLVRILVLFLVLLPGISYAQLNGSYILSGKVDDDQGKPLIGATVSIKGTTNKTSTDTTGKFSLTTSAKLPYTLVFTAIGYQPQEFYIKNANSAVNITLTTQSLLVNEVVVTASRKEEKLLRSPVAIEKLSITALKQSPGPSFYDALENVKGVQMTTTSITLKVPNTRGFNSPNNFRFMQLVDGVDMQSATLGVPLGNAIGPTELDIASVEITPGAAAALYGTNAINGLSNLFTKDPFKYQGLSFYHRQGLNHVGKDRLGASSLTEDALRYAKAFNDKFAVKVNFSYMQGQDWQSDTRNDQNPTNLKSANPAYPELTGTSNAAYDGWNKYGDDALAGSNTVSIKGITVDGKARPNLTVARTGYNEVDLVDPHVKNLKLDGTLSYKLTPNTVLSYTYRYGKLDGVFQRGNKISLQGATVQNHKIELKGKDFLVRGYESIENTGNSFNVKPLADNLDLNHASNSAWATLYGNALKAYNGGVLTSANLAAAEQAARAAADKGRVEPGTPEFDALRKTIIGINNWDIKSSLIPNAPATGGAALVQKSHMYNGEAQWDLSSKVKVVDLLVGADVRVYSITPDGNNFVDFSRPIADRNTPLADGTFGKDVIYKKYGTFTQVTKTFFDEKLKLFGSIRWDRNPYFDPKFTPRLAAVYTVNQNHNFRFTFQNGYRFPSLFEALSYVNNGRVKRVGSLPFINEGLGYLGNSYTQTSVVAFNAAVNAAGGSDQAALANRNLLKVADLPPARPEQITSFEVGYKGIVADNKVFIDIDAYTNRYDGFLGQVQVFVPNGATVGSDAAVLSMLDINRDPTTGTSTNAASQGQSRYRVYTNAKNIYHNYGSSAGVTYNFYQHYTVSGNVSFNKLKAQTASDIFVTGFNTPEWSGNISFGNREVVKNFGFNVVYKWQQSYLWESPLVTGTVPSIKTVDAQVTYRVPSYYATFKLGATDIFNKRYYQYAGGPTIGGLYYVSVTLDGLLAGNNNNK
ncbi:TonB-dependent receptor plug domain-containing protein [Mucilaginibacter rubeus]|uniref:TonB-dependent receptor n=1 Tax=Mucilaginibacter rubeus TaxID=2027860 RepID=A0AAE6MI25_9SPHI|nr:MULTISPECIES: TonB-dependent receptor [Mucilaginibacter]QEM04113.1 TonB-dependent receptor plug domain-containing protein [Mucilaginibacter rubeus]QEM16716.1 TonB-dependent receptor plug domain-containing protein [Mucilaginibacter gossypii]QTE46809.1 TonB-dependent receptor [Mucilaginibacter rubeus]QTE53406.1 TonB-dependent receptor [Mucilaginibacter rubeus]QTE58492.1 TonB-dependent receptor [Mucilaginibacter rubeus]